MPIKTHEVKWCKDSDRDHKESWGAQARGLGGLESHELADLQVSNRHLEDIKFHGSFAAFGPWREKETMIKWRLIMHGGQYLAMILSFLKRFGVELEEQTLTKLI